MAEDERVFALGDTVAIKAGDGAWVPGLAPAAKQAGLYAATVNLAEINGRKAPKPLQYVHQGSLATIGAPRLLQTLAGYGCLVLQSGGSGIWFM